MKITPKQIMKLYKFAALFVSSGKYMQLTDNGYVNITNLIIEIENQQSEELIEIQMDTKEKDE